MNNTKLNLARSWRSKNFDQIIGQGLSVRILKNSLYLNQFFPVYLCAGQRGCGKTSTARVFAAAINCQQLADFQKDPKNHQVPCLSCESCVAMAAGKHPDFIEMDAASHTGVDNVRQIIEASTLLPLMGSKKIYLIDEAHMLSKAAFNAFLKILEEPPPSVLFILATTDPEKIIDTVRSRCFQLFFNPVAHDDLLAHLQAVCKHENITYDDKGLECIVQESEGSVRDALNMLEQIRFAHGQINQQTVQSVLGHLDDDRLLQLFDIVLAGDVSQLIPFLHKVKIESFAPQPLWNKIYQLVRTALWLGYGVHNQTAYADALKPRLKNSSVRQIMQMLQFLCEAEQLFLKTSKKHQVLEMVLLRMCQPESAVVIEPSTNARVQRQRPSGAPRTDSTTSSVQAVKPVRIEQQDDNRQVDNTDGFEQWAAFLNYLECVNDHLLPSVFKQAKFVSFDQLSSMVVAEFDTRFLFFKELIDETESSTWLPLLKKTFGMSATLTREFKQLEAPVQKNDSAADGVHVQPVREQRQVSRVRPVRAAALDVSDKEKWPTTHTLLKYFSGTIKEIKEGPDEESA